LFDCCCIRAPLPKNESYSGNRQCNSTRAEAAFGHKYLFSLLNWTLKPRPGERFSSVASLACYLSVWEQGGRTSASAFGEEPQRPLQLEEGTVAKSVQERRETHSPGHGTYSANTKGLLLCDEPFFASGLESLDCSYILPGCRSRALTSISSRTKVNIRCGMRLWISSPYSAGWIHFSLHPVPDQGSRCRGCFSFM
jgi:hypothetical protein